MRKKINPVTAYMVCLCVFLFVVNITLGCVLVKQSNAALRQSVHERMLDVSETAAALIDGDVLRSLQAEDEGTDEYQSVYDTLKRFQDNIALEYIYCIRSMGNDVFVLTVDPADDPGEFGSPVVVTDALRSACGGVSAVDEEPYENAWGEFYSAYTPLLNSDGTVTELVAVDFSADWYDAQTHRQVLTVMLGCIISMAFAIFIVIMFGVHFKRRFRRMLTTVGQVSDGIETLVKSVMPNRNTAADVVVDDIVFEPDEVGELGRKICVMERQLSYHIQQVQTQALIDGLTGFGNRMAYEERVKQLDDEIKSGEADFSVALFDLNGLKQLNDMYGHERGDQAIMEVSAALMQAFEDAELFRVGGDEFVALLDKQSVDLSAVCREIDEILAEDSIGSVAKGWSSFIAGEDFGYRAVFNRADLAMYHDKKQHYETCCDRRQQ